MLNHIVIMGRLTRDPEVKVTGSGLSVVNFTVAVDRDFSGKDAEKETDFIDCVAWRKTAEFIAKYMTKGSLVVASGRLQLRTWQDKDGNNRRTAEVVVENIYFGESKRKTEAPKTYDVLTDGPALSQTDALLQQHGYPPLTDDYAMLTDADAQLPF